MRASFSIILQLSALGSAISLNRRDETPPGGLVDLAFSYIPSQKAVKMEEIKPALRADAKRIRLTYGPYKLRAAQAREWTGNSWSFDPAGTGYFYRADTDFPRDVTILETKAGLLNESFKPSQATDGLYNHHIAWFEHNQMPISFYNCGNRPSRGPFPMTVFIGGTTEAPAMTYWNEKLNTGLYVGRNDKITMMLDLVNNNNVSRSVYTYEEIEYIPGKPKGLLDTSQLIVNPGTCGGIGGMNMFISPNHQNKQFTIGGNDIFITRDGFLFNLRAHLHDGGNKMAIKVNGKVECESNAIYGGPGHMGKDSDGKEWTSLSDTTLCDIIPVKKGDRLSLEAFYDMDAHLPRKQSHGGMAEVMAELGGQFALKN